MCVHAAPLVHAALSTSHPHPRHVPLSTWAMPHHTLDPCPFMSCPMLLHVTHTLISAAMPAVSLPMRSGCLHVSQPRPRHLSPCWTSVPMHSGHASCCHPHSLHPGPFLHASACPIFTLGHPDKSTPSSSILTHSIIWPILL